MKPIRRFLHALRVRPLFLRWAWLNTAAVLGFVALGLAFAGRSSGPPLYVAAFILALTATVSGYAGLLCWRADNLSGIVAQVDLMDATEHVHFAAQIDQLLGLVGAAVGFYLISTSPAESSQDAVHHIIDSLGAGIIATVTGVLCSMLLLVEHHALTHALRKQ